MDITITIQDTAGMGGASISVDPKLEVLESAAGGDQLTPAATYALGALNAMRRVSDEGIEKWDIARPKNVKRISLPFTTIEKVEIKLHDNLVSGGVKCVAQPSFSTLAAMVAGGSPLTQVHKFALVALGRIYQMNQPRKPAPITLNP
jgi:hypothetical protein